MPVDAVADRRRQHAEIGRLLLHDPCAEHSFRVAAGLVISIAPLSVVYEAVYLLQPAEPLSFPSAPKPAVSFVPGSGLANASPCRIAVASHSPTGVAAA
jgi:hypothetical protein